MRDKSKKKTVKKKRKKIILYSQETSNLFHNSCADSLSLLLCQRIQCPAPIDIIQAIYVASNPFFNNINIIPLAVLQMKWASNLHSFPTIPLSYLLKFRSIALNSRKVELPVLVIGELTVSFDVNDLTQAATSPGRRMEIIVFNCFFYLLALL